MNLRVKVGIYDLLEEVFKEVSTHRAKIMQWKRFLINTTNLEISSQFLGFMSVLIHPIYKVSKNFKFKEKTLIRSLLSLTIKVYKMVKCTNEMPQI